MELRSKANADGKNEEIRNPVSRHQIFINRALHSTPRLFKAGNFEA
jgi:hypothetical protein